MQQSIEAILTARRPEPLGLRRTMSWSFGVHVGIVLVLLVVPRAWLVREKPEPLLMTISLGGTPGERTGGMSPIGARPVEEVAPPPKRPAPILPAAPPKSDPIATVKTSPKPPPKPSDAPATTSAPRPPTTGAQVSRGTAAAATGATGQGTGLSAGGGSTGLGLTQIDPNFCCPEYVEEMLRRIRQKWANVQQEFGTTILVFEIRRDGTFTPPVTEQSAGRMLDIASRAAFVGLQLPPLPDRYPEQTLKVHLAFEYKR